jgi:beta-glucosidase
VSAPLFPPDFVWGVATSAYQIEGGRGEDGKGDSIWDRFSDLGRLRDKGDVATDHYHRWEEDLDLLARLGVGAYRFSVAWSRVIPDGDGEPNQAGIDFYRRLVEGMAERGITPYLSLYHWDLPQALEEKGGWAERSTIDAFARYTGILVDSLGDLVGHWITQNEPWVTAMLGYRDGVFAPGMTDWATALTVGHHLLLSHGRALAELRRRDARASVGIALDCRPVVPASSSDEDVAAAAHFDGFRNRWFFDPVFGMGYPEDLLAVYRERGHIEPGLILADDLDLIGAPLDFLGLNYYTTLTVAAGGEERDDPEGPVGADPEPGFTEMGWRIDPDGLRGYLEQIAGTYSPPSILVTENGASFSDKPDAAGRVDDGRRIEYLRGHIAAVAAARQAGVAVDGYFVWSFLDNLEWTSGFSQRFGLVWVEPVSGRRIPKRSFEWYSEVVRTGRLP